MPSQAIDAFICVHQRDVGYLFDITLQSYLLNFGSKGRLMLVTNDRLYLEKHLVALGVADQMTVTSDDQWLSKEEQSLPGWFRQQIIKLRAYEFCETAQLCNVGADTVLLRPIQRTDLVDGNFPVTYYRKHRLPNIHWWYERQRVEHIGKLLRVPPKQAMRYVDFINELFCFDRATLRSLHRHLEKMYGLQPFYTVLRGLQSDWDGQKRFGEWTLYSTYLLDVIHAPVTMRNAAAGFIDQVHSERTFKTYRYGAKAVHFVAKSLDVTAVKRGIAQHHLELGAHLALPQLAPAAEL